MKQQRRFLQGAVISVVAGTAGLMLIGVLGAAPAARACWRTELLECFDQVPTIAWPFQSPVGSGRYWRRNPNPPLTTWGFQQDYYSQAVCPRSTQALWCIGYPPGNDPEYDFYPRNYDAYVIYGPINLSAAVAAAVHFYLFDRTQAQHDSVYWGASETPILNTLQTMNIAGSHSDIMNPGVFIPQAMDLSRLRNAQTRDSVSMLGRPVVYIFWRFRSDPDAVVNLGAFIDNVDIAWDDGGMDIACSALALLRPDTSLAESPQIGDSLMAEFAWSTCSGGIESYPDFHIMAVVDDRVLMDTLLTGVRAGEGGLMFTPYWIVEDTGLHVLRVVVDSLNEVAETNETNNVTVNIYHVEPPNLPPTFIWITPSTDTLWADTVAMLRWEAYDPDEEASLTFYADNDPLGCQGVLFPTGARVEHDGPDSLRWDTRNLTEGRRYYPFVQVTDAANDTCIYAPYPIIIRHAAQAAEDRADVPAKFYLEQNFPNPFNPITEVKYGLAQAGHVSLRVYDLLGREVAVLVDEEQAPGSYRALFDGSGLATGLYLYTLTAPEGTQSRKMMLLK